MGREAHVAQGRLAQDAGALWEDFLTRYIFAPLIQSGEIVRMDKLVPPVRVVGSKGGKPLLTPEAPTGADWIAILQGGRYAALEAKTTDGERLPLSALTPRQVEHLDQVATGGGLALLLVQYRLGPGKGSHHAVPWGSAPWKVRRTTRALYLEDLAPWPLKNATDLRRALEMT